MNHSARSYRPLQKMFMEVPPFYDLMNRLLTLRLDSAWRRRAAIQCLENNPERILDLCCGTGDLSMELKSLAPCTTEVAALDYSGPMLDLARKKALKRKLPGIIFQLADASAMPFPDRYFDSVGIAFAFRNLSYRNPDRDQFLAEIFRVLRPGGRFVIVETSQPENNIFRKLFHFYMKHIAAPVGGLLSGHRSAYRYLAHSAVNYYKKEELHDLLCWAGFSKVESRAYMGGIAGIFIATK